MKKYLAVLLLLLLCSTARSFNPIFPLKRDSIQHAQQVESSVYPFVYKDRVHAHYIRSISNQEAWLTAFLIQFVYIGGYVATQWDNIQENGSVEKWWDHLGMLHFDKDSYDYNIITHIGNAHYSYLFYRAAGYKKINSFVMTAIGSTIFEFLIETVTEPASIQDLWQTPVLGTLLGITTEKLSLILVNSDHKVLNWLGYLFNPFLAFEDSHYQLTTVPIFNPQQQGVGLTIKF